MVLHTCTDDARFKLHSLNSLQAALAYLAENEDQVTQQAFAKMQTNLGFNLCKEGVLRCNDVLTQFDPTRGTMFDWAHIFLVSGLWHFEVNLLLVRLSRANVKQQQIHEAFQEYHLPSFIAGKGCDIKKVFQKKKTSDADFKSSATEALAAYPILRDILHNIRQATVLPAEAAEAISCYMLHCKCLDLLQRTLCDNVGHDELRTTIKAYLDRYLAVYPDETFLPKAHMSMHLAGQLRQHGCLISCLTHERRHKELKRYANVQCNSRQGTEKSLLQEMQLTHMEALERLRLDFPNQLQLPRPASPSLQRAFAAYFGLFSAEGLTMSGKAEVTKWRLLATGDVVLLADPVAVAEILYHCCFEGRLLTCVTLLDACSTPNMFRKSQDNCTFVQASSIRGPCITRKTGEFIHIVPQHFAA